MATKRIKLIKAWGMAGAGAEVEFDVPIADLLIQRGRAKEVVEEIAIKAVLDLSGSEERLRPDIEKSLAPAPTKKLKRSKRGKR